MPRCDELLDAVMEGGFECLLRHRVDRVRATSSVTYRVSGSVMSLMPSGVQFANTRGELSHAVRANDPRSDDSCASRTPTAVKSQSSNQSDRSDPSAPQRASCLCLQLSTALPHRPTGTSQHTAPWALRLSRSLHASSPRNRALRRRSRWPRYRPRLGGNQPHSRPRKPCVKWQWWLR